MLKAILSKAPEDGIAQHYEQRGDYWFLRVEPVTMQLDGKEVHYSLDDTGGLRNALADRKARQTTASTRAETLETELSAAKDKIKMLEDAEPDAKAASKHKSEMEQLQSKHKGEIEARDKRNDSLKGEVRRLGLDSAVDAGLTDVAKDGANAKLLRPHVMSALDILEDKETGRFNVIVKGKDGNARLSLKEGSTAPMGIGELLETMSKDETYEGSFKGASAAGSGANGGGKPPGSNSGGAQDANLSATERLKRFREAQGA